MTCIACLCQEEDKVLATQNAPGSCPYCGGPVMATDVESAWTLLRCLPLSVRTKRRYSCTHCSRRLVTYP